jgi:hypothetical protein
MSFFFVVFLIVVYEAYEDTSSLASMRQRPSPHLSEGEGENGGEFMIPNEECSVFFMHIPKTAGSR